MHRWDPAGACNLFASMEPAQLKHKLEALKRHCDDIGRDYDGIDKTVLGQVRLGPGGMSPGELVEMGRGLADNGSDTFLFSPAGVHELAPIETVGREVIPTVAGF